MAQETMNPVRLPQIQGRLMVRWVVKGGSGGRGRGGGWRLVSCVECLLETFRLTTVFCNQFSKA